MKPLFAVAVMVLCAVAFFDRCAHSASPNEEIQSVVKEAQQLQASGAKQDREKAIEKFKQAMSLADKAGNKGLMGLISAMTGLCYSAIGKNDKALQYLERSLPLLADQKNRDWEAIALAGLAAVHDSQGNYETALIYYEKALVISEKLKDSKGRLVALYGMGKIHKDRGEYEKALQVYQRRLEIIRSRNDKEEEAKALKGIASIYKAMGQSKRAIEPSEKAIALFRSINKPGEAAGVLLNLGNAYEDLSQIENALKCWKEALAIRRRLKDRKGESGPLHGIGKAYGKWGYHEKAVEYYEQALALDREFQDHHGEAIRLHSLGRVYQSWGYYDKALENYTKALAMYREWNDRANAWRVLSSIGGLYWRWGQYEKAMKCHEEALQISTDLNDLQGKATCYSNFGGAHQAWGQYDKAVELYNKSLTIRTELKDSGGQASCYSSLGGVYQAWGQYDKAVELYNKSLTIRTELKDSGGQASCYSSLGGVYQNWGQYEHAVVLYNKALAIRAELRDPSGQASCLMGLGNVHWQKAEYQEALSKFQEARRIATELKVPTRSSSYCIAGVFLDMGDIRNAESFVQTLEAEYKDQRNQTGLWSFLGRLHLRKSDYRNSKGHYEKLLSFAEQNRSAGDLFTACTGLGMCQEGLEDLIAAAESFRKAVEHTEEVRSTISEEQRETFFDVKTGGFRRTEPYEGLARVLTKMNKPVEAFRSSEFTKARVFAETMARSLEKDAADVPPEIRKADTDLNQRLSVLKSNRQAAYEKGHFQALSVLDPQIKALEEKRDAHIKMLREQYPLFAATKYPQPMDLSQTALADNEWVLSYDVTDPGLIVYLTKGKTLKKALFKPVSRKDLDALVRQFREPLDIKPNETTEEKIAKFDFGLGKKLADILLADMLPELPKDAPLIIVPADCLSVLPFEMLVLNAGGKIVEKNGIPNTSGAEYFGDRNPISYYQSITALTLARNFAKQKGAGSRMLVMCDPVFSDDDPRQIKAKKDERRAKLDTITNDVLMSAKSQNGIVWKRMALTGELGQSLKKTDPGLTDMYEGLQATKAMFKQQKFDQYKNIVFATHGYAGTDLGGLKEPVLVLTLVNQPPGETGFLGMSEVMGLKMNADMVALTACQSGLGKRISGEGTMGMGRAFQYAGAKSTLMTLWSVAQKSSVDLTKSFFKHLKEGKPKLEALKLARDEIRKNGYDHPFFWASFILVGEVGADAASRESAGPEATTSTAMPRASESTVHRSEPQDTEPRTVAFDVDNGRVSVQLTERGKPVITHKIRWGAKNLEERVRAFTSAFHFDGTLAFEDNMKRFDPNLGKSLYEELLSPVLANVPRGVPLRIVQHPLLANLPFEALVVGGHPRWEEIKDAVSVKGLTYLGDLYHISYATNRLKERPVRSASLSKAQGGRILVVADPVFQADDPRIRALPRDNRERILRSLPSDVLMGAPADRGLVFGRLALTEGLATSISGLFPGQVEVITGPKASKQALMNMDLTRYATIVFATHGYGRSNLPGIEEPVLVLTLPDQPEGQNGFLTASEAKKLRLDADLVVLVASESGLGKHDPRTGISSMGNAFLEAGARSVLVTLWSESESASVKLVERLFQHMKSGKDKVAALRFARNDIRKDGYDHPFFWAGFVLVGEVDAPHQTSVRLLNLTETGVKPNLAPPKAPEFTSEVEGAAESAPTDKRTSRKNALAQLDLRPTPQEIAIAFGAGVEASEEAEVDLNASNDRFSSYLLHVKKRIEEKWIYPQAQAMAGIGGNLTLVFKISNNGDLLEAKVLNSSGHAELDESALKSITLAAPFHPFPPKVRAKRLRVRANFIYVTNEKGHGTLSMSNSPTPRKAQLADPRLERGKFYQSFVDRFPSFGREEFTFAHDDVFPDWKKRFVHRGSWFDFLLVYEDFVKWWEKNKFGKQTGMELWNEFVKGRYPSQVTARPSWLKNLSLGSMAGLPLAAAVVIPGLWLFSFGTIGRSHRRPFLRVVLVLLCGCGAATCAGFIETTLSRFLSLRGQLPAQAASAFLGALVQQSCLFLAVWLSVYRNDKFRAPIDGVVYSATAAIGFASVENLVYVHQLGWGVLGSRLFIATPAHLMFAAMWGSAMGMVCFKRENEYGTLLKGFSIAVLLQGIYNSIIAVNPKHATWWLITLLIVMAWLVYCRIQNLYAKSSLPMITDHALVRCNLCGTCVMEGEEVCSRCGEPLPAWPHLSGRSEEGTEKTGGAQGHSASGPLDTPPAIEDTIILDGMAVSATPSTSREGDPDDPLFDYYATGQARNDRAVPFPASDSDLLAATTSGCEGMCDDDVVKFFKTGHAGHSGISSPDTSELLNASGIIEDLNASAVPDSLAPADAVVDCVFTPDEPQADPASKAIEADQRALTHHKYQPDPTDILWNTNWGLPLNALPKEEALKQGLVAFKDRWVHPEEENILGKEYAVYRNLWRIEAFALVLAVPMLIAGAPMLVGGQPFGGLLCILLGGTILASGVGLYRLSPWCAFGASFLQIVFFILGLCAFFIASESSLGLDAVGRVLRCLLGSFGVVLIYMTWYLGQHRVQRVFRKPPVEPAPELAPAQIDDLAVDICGEVLSREKLLENYGISQETLNRYCRRFVHMRRITESDYQRIVGEPFVIQG